jgi:phospholipid/cholesterol/gamma-HCH transport system substrate-binding protein
LLKTRKILKLTKEIKTAILVISSILLFIWGYSYLKGTDILTDYNTFYIEYNDVEGLVNSSPVTINGLVVGKVKNISFINMSSWKPMVEIQINKEYSISKSSIALIYEPGLIGGKMIQIVPGTLNPSVLAESGDYLKGDIKSGLTALVSEKLQPLQEKIEKVMVSTDILLSNLNETLDANTKQNIKNSISKFSETMAEFSDISKTVNTTLTDNKSKINNSLANFENVTGNFAKISDSLAQVNIKQTVQNLEKTLANIDKIMAELENGNGTMGKLLKDDKMYTNFTKASNELELLLEDLRLNPTRYVNVSLFGKKNKPYVAPTEIDSSKIKN